ncbi:MAG: hypothetical protein RMI89_04875 [Gloeomargarita sp. SKYBB_i_bin120]|nr:hypothetical protein [Gloeomargarita sp. SKYG98]MCS7292295.1 hypothetical protein [Gloeomargarita sp. SKYB120]MDW8177855.1 hypothetical protein [Gloeomargarita sp. SKYBB_i_bin120]
MAPPPVSAIARAVAEVVPLLVRYRYEADEAQATARVETWAKTYPVEWLRPAVVETLYQARYKSISVEQVLNLWQRQGRPHPHYSGDFERLVSRPSPSPPRTPAPRPWLPPAVTEPQYQKLRALATVQPWLES